MLENDSIHLNHDQNEADYSIAKIKNVILHYIMCVSYYKDTIGIGISLNYYLTYRYNDNIQNSKIFYTDPPPLIRSSY